MKIQSLSIVVPSTHCINHCAFCVSCMHCDRYKDQMNENLPFFDLYLEDFLKRLEFARDNGCNTLMLTGNSEPQQNRKFLSYFGMMMRMMQRPFRWIEMQTTGAMLDDGYLRFLRNHVGVNIISLSVSSFNDTMNRHIIGQKAEILPDLSWLCSEIKRYDFGLRLSLNLTNEFDQYALTPGLMFKRCKDMGADQATLRILYTSGNDTPQDRWIAENKASEELVRNLKDYIRSKGHVLGVLPHGAIKCSVDGVCVVIDSDCMDKAEKVDEDYKYLILQPDCKLYSAWDDPASLIF